MKYLLFAFLVVVAGCSGERNSSSISVRDSAGIQIIVATRPSWGDGGGWQISSDPTLSIGEREGDSTTQFQQIVGVVRLSDSQIVVADAGSNSIRSFDGSGSLIRTVGRSGEGPGNFVHFKQSSGLAPIP